MTETNDMDLKQAIRKRRSIRKYTDRPIDPDVASELKSFVEECNGKSGLRMQLILNDKKGMSGLRSLILKNARNYLAIVGKNDGNLAELGGYWGEKVVLRATQLGIASCWFSMGSKKDLIVIAPDEKLLMVVAMGLPATEAKARSSKPLEKLYAIRDGGEAPDWFIEGVKAARLAPTANNGQKFLFTLTGDGRVRAESLGGAFSRTNLGIVKCHFETGASPQTFEWA